MTPPTSHCLRRHCATLALVAALGSLLFGHDGATFAGALLLLRQRLQLSGTTEGLLGGAVLFGAMLGGLLGGVLADRLGRRRALLVAAGLFVLGEIGAAFAPGFLVFGGSRVLAGIGMGTAALVGPLYVAESTPTAIRGASVTVSQVLVAIGFLLGYLADTALSQTGQWRSAFLLATLPGLALAGGMALLPESPRWLLRQGDLGATRHALAFTHAPGDIDAACAAIQAAIRRQPRHPSLWQPAIRTALSLGVLLAFFQQGIGVNALSYYFPVLFVQVSPVPAPVLLAMITGISVFILLASIAAALLIDRLGRRPLLLIGLGGTSVCCWAIGAIYRYHVLTPGMSWLLFGCYAVYFCAYAFGVGPVFWLLTTEIYPLAVRGVAMGITTMVSWGTSILVVVFFPLLGQSLGDSWAFWLLGGIGVIGWGFAYLRVPETKQRTLESLTP